MTQAIKFINPDGLFKSPAFSQVAVTSGSGKTIYIGGQNSVDSAGKTVGQGDIAAQTERVMQNLEIALTDSGGDWSNVVKLSIHIVQGQDLNKAFQASQKFISKTKNPPTITGVFVSGLTNPDFLVEVDAIAFIAD